MKIAIVRQRYNPFGGAERFVERALGALVDQGAEVTLITRNWDGSPRADFKQQTCDPAYSRLWSGRLGRERSFAKAVQAQIEAADYDIVQSHERIPGCMVFRAGDGVHAAWLKRRERILGPLQQMAQNLSSFHRYQLAVERDMFRHPALKAVICNSHMVQDEVATWYGVPREKLNVIYNGVDTAVFSPALAGIHRNTVRQSLGIPSVAPMLLYVGSGFERKGVPQLLAAFAAASVPDAHLVIVGVDRKLALYRRHVAKLRLSDRVHFTGGVKDVTPFYGAADGFVLPTLYDPCPNAALEAMASGLPMLTSFGCGAQEWVADGQNGFVADMLDPRALTEGLHKLLAMTGSQSARQAARAAVEEFTLAKMSEQLISLYARLRP